MYSPALVDLTLLKAGATREQVYELCARAESAGCYGVCISPLHLPALRDPNCPLRRGKRITVANFPLGAGDQSEVTEGICQLVPLADEIDVVAPLGLAAAGEWDALSRYLERWRGAAGETPCKLILEVGLFTEEQLVEMVCAGAAAGFEFMKTSTGMLGCPPVTPEQIALLARIREERHLKYEIKASGGVRVREQADALVAAGASRLGCSQLIA